MTLVRLKGIICLTIPLVLAFALGDAAVASLAQSGQTVYVEGLETPVQLPVVFPPVKKMPPQKPKPPKPTEQELRTRAEAGNVDAMKAYADFLPSPSDFPWYLKAAEAGSPGAMMDVAIKARDGNTGYGIDRLLSDKWSNKVLQMGRQALSVKNINVLKLLLDSDGRHFLDAATKAQYVVAIGRAGGFEIEDSYYSAINAFPNTPEKIQLLQKCSNDGHPWCTSRLANDYLYGNDGLVIDHALGIKLLTKVAQAGYKFSPILFYSSESLPNLSKTETIQLWKTAIEHGALDYAIPLSNAYRDGDGVPKSVPIAAALLQTLIQRPDTTGGPGGWPINGVAVWKLASMYVDGKSFPVNEQAFLRVINLASSLDVHSRETVGQFLLTSDNGLLSDDTLNITESTRLLLLKSVVENSSPFNDTLETYYRYQAALGLGDLYSNGQKVKQSYADAMTWYQKAEQIATGPVDHDFQYDGAAAVKIGIIYEKGLGIPKDSSTAMSWYRKAADDMMSRSASPSDMIKLLNSSQLPKEYVDRVISSVRSSAEAGNDEAQYDLGEMYYGGKYMPQSYSEAAGWFEKCGNGDGDLWKGRCIETLAKMYLQGQGVMHDPAKAAQQLFDLTLLPGWINPNLMDILLPMYCGGEGIPIDKPKAFALFKKSADGGASFDELGVGAMYQMGWGVQQDLAEAFNWYRKAAANKDYGSTQAKADLTRIFRDCKGTPENFNAAISLYEKASGGQH